MSLARIAAIVLAAMLSMAVPRGAAAADYPTRPITLFDPYPVGSISDIGARVFSQQLSLVLGQPVRVVNDSGGGGAVAAGDLQSRPADGYSLLWCVGSDLAEIIAGRELSYGLDDFKGIELLGGEASGVIIRADDKRFSDFKSMLAYAAAHPGALSVAGVGAGEIKKGYEELRDAAKIKVKYIPYQGGAPEMAALLGGHVDVAITAPSNAKDNDKLRVIGLLTAAPSYPALPGPATSGALGYGFDSQLLRGIFAKKNTPPAVIDQLYQAIRKAVQTDAWKDFAGKFSQSLTATGPAGLDAYMAKQVADWTSYLKKLD